MAEPTKAKITVKNIHVDMFSNHANVILKDEKGFSRYYDISKKKLIKFLNKHIKEIKELLE